MTMASAATTLAATTSPEASHPLLAIGAGQIIKVPAPTQAQPPNADANSGGDGDTAVMDAYFVAPTAHVGRVVTGVVFLSEAMRSNHEVTQMLHEGQGVVEKFGLASISFADKLAEQGYKILVVPTMAVSVVNKGASETEGTSEHHLQQLEQAARFLKQQHSMQRIALFGFGAGADLAIKCAVERSTVFDCYVAMSPDGKVPWKAVDPPAALPPTLLLLGEKTAYPRSDSYQELLTVFTQSAISHPSSAVSNLRARVFRNQSRGFAFSGITDEDAATQAIAEVLDWLATHLHRFRVAACTSDTDPWWPQGRNGPFLNVGLQTWQATRSAWILATQERPERPPPVPSHVLFDGLSSVRRTFELPHRMALADIVELFVEVWEVQQ